MSRTNEIDSGSRRMPASSWKSPTGIHEYRVCWTARSDGSRDSMANSSGSATTKLAHDSAVARSGPKESVRRPPRRRTAAPSSGRATSSHAYAGPAPAAAALAVTRDVTCVLLLGLEQVDVVDRGRSTRAEDHDDDRQTDDHLRRGHHHDEQGDDLTLE